MRSITLAVCVCTFARADPARDQAIAMVAKMTMEEKITVVHGSGSQSGYGGDTCAAPSAPGNATNPNCADENLPRLGLPPLLLADGPQGYRTVWLHGDLRQSSTQYPSLLSLGASFDKHLARQLGEAMGAEFAGKGANVQLGPALNVHRVAVNGRNCEVGALPCVSNCLSILHTRCAVPERRRRRSRSYAGAGSDRRHSVARGDGVRQALGPQQPGEQQIRRLGQRG
jgi:hypothetical protein